MSENLKDKQILVYDYKEYNISYPVIITRYEIMQVNGLNNRYLNIYFQKISYNVKAFKFTVKCYSDFGEVETISDISLQEVDKKDFEFLKVIPIKSEINKAEVNITKCVLLDNSIVEPKHKQMVINTFKPFNEEDSEAGKRLLPNAKGFPIDNVSHWYCACGVLYSAESVYCERCQKVKKEIFELVTTEKIQKEKEQMQIELTEQSRQKEKRKKRNKLLAIIGSVVTAVCILIGILVGTLTPFPTVSVNGMTFSRRVGGQKVYSLNNYKGKSKNVDIPSKVRGLLVTEIGYSAFEDNKYIVSVTIPSNVERIAGGAFRKCTSLKSIIIPDGVTYISGHTFSYCSSLESITIPDNLKVIDKYAFFNCSSLESIIIPESVTTINVDAFAGCSNLTIYAKVDSKPDGWSIPKMYIKNIIYGYKG